MNPYYTAIAQRANHRCEYCKAPEVVFNFPFEVEHIIPLSRQGSNDEANLALACRSCNLRKGNRTSGLSSRSNIEARFSIREKINGVTISKSMLNLVKL